MRTRYRCYYVDDFGHELTAFRTKDDNGDCCDADSSRGEANEMLDIIRTLYFRVKSAKHVPDKVHALTAFLEQAETLLERHGELK